MKAASSELLLFAIIPPSETLTPVLVVITILPLSLAKALPSEAFELTSWSNKLLTASVLFVIVSPV